MTSPVRNNADMQGEDARASEILWIGENIFYCFALRGKTMTIRSEFTLANEVETELQPLSLPSAT
jgi:hypothetical protein